MSESGALARLKRRFVEPPPGLDPVYHRYYAAVRYGYPIALAWHALFILLFALVGATPLAWINVASVAIWVLVIWLHLEGYLRSGVVLCVLEVTLHAVLAVMLVGWDTGFQYYLLVLAATTFFTPLGPMPLKAASAAGVGGLFALLFFLYADTTPPIALETWVSDAMYVGNVLSTFFVIGATVANYDLITLRAEAALKREKARSEDMAELLRTMFGRYLAPEVMASLLENPAALELGGEKRRVTVMLTDLRGFTSLAERLPPEQVVRMLNGYFEVMMEVLTRYHGTVNEIIGDALLVLFGAPQDMPDRAERAVACAIEMQNAMARVNERNRAAGLPRLEMGIGLNDAEVVVGNIGSATRSKYSAVGAGVNLASRIESFTVGGQVLVSESVRRALGEALRIDGRREVLPKGAEAPLRIYEVGGIAGRFNVALEREEPELVRLAAPEPVRYALLEGKQAGAVAREGRLVRVGHSCAEFEAAEPPAAFADLRLSLAAAGDALAARDFYGKVLAVGSPALVRFTAVPPEVEAYFEALRRRGGA
ncbi:MAG TPA: adenylate/guanylate cyclase domain-containing protein [Burkholderiales bacterium]|nr:adenylate/guanylate cyclase domain-containing protein [Burkholderiales bacterium]